MKTRMKLLGAAVAVVIVLSIFFYVMHAGDQALTGQAIGTGDASTPITIGAVYPLSGPLAVYGKEYARGVELAVQEINAKGGINGRPLRIILEDDKGETKESVTAVNRLISINEVPVILTAMSGPTLATAPIANAQRVIMISATVSRVGKIGKYIFRDYWDMQDQGTALARVVNKEGYHRVAIIAVHYPDYDFFKEGFDEAIGPGVTVQVERFSLGDIDFKTQLAKVKEFEPEAIILYSFPGNELITIVQQLSALGMDTTPLLDGATGLGWSFVTEALRPELAGRKVIANWYALDPTREEVRTFVREYAIAYNESLNGDATYPYEDVHALAKAMILCDKLGLVRETDCLTERLLATDQDGVAGHLAFDAEGNSLRQSYLRTYQEEGWQRYDIE